MTIEQGVWLGVLLASTVVLLIATIAAIAAVRWGVSRFARFERVNLTRRDGSVQVDASFKEPQ